jgi:Stress responsive A/B Barrel Domain
MIRHFVALRFNAGTCSEVKLGIFASLAALVSVIEGILNFHSGPNVSVEPLSRGFDDVFWFDFRDVAARDAYLIHPEHQVIGARIVAATGGIEGVFVFDVKLP